MLYITLSFNANTLYSLTCDVGLKCCSEVDEALVAELTRTSRCGNKFDDFDDDIGIVVSHTDNITSNKLVGGITREVVAGHPVVAFLSREQRTVCDAQIFSICSVLDRNIRGEVVYIVQTREERLGLL